MLPIKPRGETTPCAGQPEDVDQSGQHFATSTVTTPHSGSKTRTRPYPVPLSSVVPDAGLLNSRLYVEGRSVSSMPPRCSRSNSNMSEGYSPSSSVTSFHGQAKFDSGAAFTSFRWAPDQVLVQSWHRKLSETYRDYSMVNIVGEGRHGTVIIVQHRTSEKYYACKILNKGDHDPKALRSEIETLKRLDHPNIVRLHETNEDREHVYLLMELCLGGDLFSRVSDDGPLPENVAQSFAYQMLCALNYCHGMGTVHRDVKPENFLLATTDTDDMQQTLKLADFGVATRITRRSCQPPGDDSKAEQVQGSLPYMAPEMFTRQWTSLVRESSGSIRTLAAGDVWSAGVVLYVMLSGNLPYGSNPDMICSGEKPDFSGEVWQAVSNDALDLIQNLLNPDHEARCTAKQALEHQWFQTYTDGCDGSSSFGNFLSVSAGMPETRGDLARLLLRCLRYWRKLPKLRRITIAAIAKRLEVEHPSHSLARSAHRNFNDSSNKLRCERFVQALNAALSQPAGGGDLCSSPTTKDLDLASFESSLSAAAPTAANSSSRTGLHIRQRFKHYMRRLSKLSEESPSSSGSPGAGGATLTECEDLVSLTELRHLVDSLDGMKDGFVDYTLLVAALLPRDVYYEEQRIKEIFEQFDFKKRGVIRPEDLLASLQTKDASVKDIADMMSDFDTNGDGVLDYEEFRAMLQ